MSNVIHFPRQYDYKLTKVVNGKRIHVPFRGRYEDIPKGYNWCGRRVITKGEAA